MLNELTRPSTLEELERAIEAGDYEPVIEEHLDHNKWTWHRWSCPRCDSLTAAPFDWWGVHVTASRHMRRHLDDDRQYVHYKPLLDDYNSRPHHQAWYAGGGRIEVRVEYPPSPLTLWLKRSFSQLTPARWRRRTR